MSRRCRRLLLLMALLVSFPIAAFGAYYALLFDGSNDVVTIPDSPSLDIAGDFTLEAWVKLPASQDYPTYSSGIVGKAVDNFNWNTSYYFGIRNADNALLLNIGDGVTYQLLEGAHPLPTDRWVHVAGVRSEDSLSLYVDGVRDTAVTRQLDQYVNDAPVRFGGTPSGHGYQIFLAGAITEVRIWEAALSPSDIARYRWFVPPDTPGLVGYWPCGEATGQAVLDLSPASNNGFLGATEATESNDPVRIVSPITGVVSESPLGVRGFLEEPSPNPARRGSAIRFQADETERSAVISIHNVKGCLVRTLVVANLYGGENLATWDLTDRSGRRVPSGVYFVSLRAGGGIQTKKLVVLK